MGKLKEFYKLDNKRIASIMKHGLGEKNKEFYKNEKEMDFHRESLMILRDNASKTTQGFTEVGDLPHWMSKGSMKELSALYKMAYVMTGNIKRNIINPLVKYQNPLPIIRWAASSFTFGWSKWALYSYLYGQFRPGSSEKDESWFQWIMQNLYRGEFLGIFTNTALSPYGPSKKEKVIPFLPDEFTPIVANFGANVASAFTSPIMGTKTVTQSIHDLLKESAVAYNHFNEFRHKHLAENKMYMNHKKANTMVRNFVTKNKEMFPEKNSGSFFAKTERTSLYRPMKEYIILGEHEKAAEAYWVAYNYLMDEYTGPNYRLGFKRARQRTISALRQSYKSIDPLYKIKGHKLEALKNSLSVQDQVFLRKHRSEVIRSMNSFTKERDRLNNKSGNTLRDAFFRNK